jgi:hypothetical protein
MLISPLYKKSTIDANWLLFTPRIKITDFSIKFCSNNALKRRLPDARMILCAFIWEPSPQARVTSEKSLSLCSWAKEEVTFSTKSFHFKQKFSESGGGMFVFRRKLLNECAEM